VVEASSALPTCFIVLNAPLSKPGAATFSVTVVSPVSPGIFVVK